MKNPARVEKRKERKRLLRRVRRLAYEMKMKRRWSKVGKVHAFAMMIRCGYTQEMAEDLLKYFPPPNGKSTYDYRPYRPMIDYNEKSR